ncbi:uncharacterized protein [Haliotis cracherodii]|uniref:uncharacterized protein n=1 Tax=Haliotis cracherodii TaxID=6455 RepID=UPI0039EACD52
MAEFMCLSWLLTYTSLICFCNCQGSTVSVINRLNQFQEDLLDNKYDLLRMEKRILDIIDVVKISLKAELKVEMWDQVREAMAEILQGESLQDIVKSQINTELRPLKQGYHQMKRQLHHVTRSLKDFQEETTVFHESVLKEAHVGNRENSSDVCVREKQRLRIELQKCDVYTANLKRDIERFIAFNKTNQSQVSQLKTNLAVRSSQTTKHVASTSRTPVLTTPVTTPRTPLPTTPVTTPRPQVEKSRILIAPLGSHTQHQFLQLNIHSNSPSVYQYLNMKKVSAVAYTAKTNKLLIGFDDPHRIVSSTLDTSYVTVLREGVQASGLAVDEARDIVFIATCKPQYSISRMSTQGKDFTTIIDLSKYGGIPRQITLDTRRKRIYGCSGGKLFIVTYDGQGLATLATGNNMFAVTLDQTAGVLYYNNVQKLMKMTVSNNVSTEVTTLTALPWNMILYRGTIYYGGYGSTIVGAVNVTYNTVAYTLQSIRMRRVYYLLLCLIP